MNKHENKTVGFGPSASYGVNTQGGSRLYFGGGTRLTVETGEIHVYLLCYHNVKATNSQFILIVDANTLRLNQTDGSVKETKPEKFTDKQLNLIF